MDEARAVLARLDRIERLTAADAPPDELLPELHELAREALAWARRERDPAAAAAVEACVEALGRDAIVPA
jgi:hypothetical protein